MLVPNTYARPQAPTYTPRGVRPMYHDYIIAGEYKNKKSLYLPPKIKKLLHSSDWKNRVYETHFGQLTIYSLAMSFLKAMAIILSIEEKRSLNYRNGTCYKMLQKCKLYEFLDNPEVSFEKCMEEHKKAFKSFIDEMRDTINRQNNPLNVKVIDLINLLVNIDDRMFANDIPAFVPDQQGDIIREAKTFLHDMGEREFPVEIQMPHVEKSSIFIRQISKHRFLKHREAMENHGNEEKKEVNKEEEKVPENWSPNKMNESTHSKILLEPIAEEDNSAHIDKSSKFSKNKTRKMNKKRIRVLNHC